MSGTGTASAAMLENDQGQNVLTGPLTINDPRGHVVNVNSGTIAALPTTLTISGNVSGPGGLIKTGVGVFALSGTNNTYSGGTTINGGILALGSGSALGSSGNITFTGGTLQFSSANTNDYSARFLNSTAAIALDTNNQSLTLANSINGSNQGGLAKLGTGTLILTAANTYAGATTVGAGTLQLGNADSLPGTTAVTIGGADAGSLDLQTNTVDVAGLAFAGAGGTLALSLAGSGPYGNLTVSGSAVLNGGSLWIGGITDPSVTTYVLLTAASFTGSFSSINLPDATFHEAMVGNSIELIRNGTTGVANSLGGGQFAGAAGNNTVSQDGAPAVPEPATLALLAAAAGLIGWARRRGAADD
jgi:autotransporter-associated beta strand protein